MIPALTSRLRALLLLAPLLCASCGFAVNKVDHSPWDGLANYTKARLFDALDVIPVSVAVGYGLSAQVRASPYFGLGAGWANSWRFGQGEQRFGPFWFEKERGIPVWRYYRLQTYLDYEPRIPGGDPLWFNESKRYRASSLVVFPGMSRDGMLWWPVLPPYFQKSPWEWPGWSNWNLLNVEASVFAGVVGVRVALSPLQWVDYMVGWFTFDPANDDPRTLPALWPDPKASPSFPDEEPERSESGI